MIEITTSNSTKVKPTRARAFKCLFMALSFGKEILPIFAANALVFRGVPTTSGPTLNISANTTIGNAIVSPQAIS